jgi:hypothetical protein
MKLLKFLSYVVLFAILVLYPIYYCMYYGTVGEHYGRHIAQLKGNSPFFNPWQYRVFSTYVVEGWYQILQATIYRATPEEQTYYNAFKYFRILQHIVIFFSVWHLYKLFTPNKHLIILMLVFLSGAMAPAAWLGDFTFNTYCDILFYVWGAYLVFTRKHLFWLLPLTFLASFNRETSIFIPFLLVINYQGFLDKKTRVKYLTIFFSCFLIYWIMFLGIRLYYGYQPPADIGIKTGWPILHFNLTDPKTIMQLLATLSVLPLYTLFQLHKVDLRLQILFWLMVPAWFAAHFLLVWVQETRLFLVPLTIIFIPIILDLIQRSLDKHAGKQPA